MGYTYTPAYYSSLQDSITSICKTILPFSFKKRRLTAAEQKLSKQQSDNLKWQQNSYHQILNMMGLQKEGILAETEVSAFRTHLLDTLIASKGPHNEQPSILRDKLLFLQELLYAKCISAEDYHASKRPLLQRLAVQGAELEARDVIVGGQKQPEKSEEEEWSVIDLKDEQSLINKDNSSSNNKSKHGVSAVKHIKDAASVFGFGSFQKLGKTKEQKSIFDLPAASSNQFPVDNASSNHNQTPDDNPFWNDTHKESESETKSIFMSDISLTSSDSDKFGEEQCHGVEKGKRGAFRALFQGDKSDEREAKLAKKQWGFDGLKKWKRSNVEDDESETIPMPLSERSTDVGGVYMQGPDTKQIRRKLISDGSSSGFYIDKVVGNNIKKELSRIQSELSSTNPNFQFSNDQMDAISTKLPVDKSDLKQFFPKSWCERYGDVVLDVVKKEFKDHVGEMENMRKTTLERRYTSSKRWTTFEDDENCHPNRVSPANSKANSYF
ncbi:hypothetical protein BVRB_8g192660 [Beta vulgaris subsp. vulgaris]|nr:hypothetical protein BVRB_8g192660 [Beta vulgaris subsp. vulgaris]